MRIYADKCHHGKEEELLFPLLGKKCVPLQGCLVGALTMEHGKDRMQVKGLVAATEACQKGDPGGSQDVIRALRKTAELFPHNIWKENCLLFPLTNKVLNSKEQQSLCQLFEQVEERVGRDVH